MMMNKDKKNEEVMEKMQETEHVQITKKDVDRVFFRWITRAQSGWNYETMQGLGYCCTMLPFLKKVYKDPKELNDMVKIHLQYFNTNVTTGGLVLGVDLALESENGYKSKDMVPAIKTGLMGPVAGVGDTFFSVTINTVLGSIATYMALQGSPLGVILWMAASVVKLCFSRWFTHLAFSQGQKVISQLSGTLKRVTDASTVLGMMVVGALIPTVVKVKCILEPQIGENVINIQEQMFDTMMPGMIPAMVVAFVYWLLGRKKMNSTKAIFIVMILCVLVSVLKILG